MSLTLVYVLTIISCFHMFENIILFKHMFRPDMKRYDFEHMKNIWKTYVYKIICFSYVFLPDLNICFHIYVSICFSYVFICFHMFGLGLNICIHMFSLNICFHTFGPNICFHMFLYYIYFVYVFLNCSNAFIFSCVCIFVNNPKYLIHSKIKSSNK